MERDFDVRPTIIVPDTSPLIHLAAGGLLHVLTSLGPVIVVDVVMLEATHDLEKPFAREIAVWLAEGTAEGTNTPIRIVEAPYADVYRASLALGMRRPRGAGEVAIVDWLADALEQLGGPALVVYEDMKVPRLIRLEGLTGTVFAATTRSVLDIAEARGVIHSAAEAWAAIVRSAPSASPANDLIRIRPSAI